MARTLLELFKTMPIGSSGKTAEETYGVRNSKDIGIQTNSVILNNSSVYGINLVRRTLGVSRGESVAEQELTGIRPLYVLSSPIIYGTALLRISTQQSDQTNKMKASANGGAADSGIIGGALEKAGDSVKGGLKKLGVSFPSDMNPTSYYEKLKVDNKSEIPTIIAGIKGDSAGNLAGKLLSQPQTPSQLVKGAAGEAVGFLKNKVRGKLFGERSTTGFAQGDNNSILTQTINYGSDNGINMQAELDGVIDAGGTTYSKTIDRPQPIDVTKTGQSSPPLAFTDGEDEGEFSLANKTLSVKLRDFNDNRSVNPEKYKEIKANDRTINKRGFGEGTRTNNGTTVSSDPYRDMINLTPVFDTDVNNTIFEDNVDDLNFIPLKFTLLYNKKTIHFRSVIDGISETFSPSWDSAKFIGNPFNYYTYGGIERSVSFNLKVMANSETELKQNWERLSFLSSLTYPADYQSSTSYIIPPFIKFTLGDMYKGKEGFIESLSYSVDDNGGWEIGLNRGMENYKLPKKIDVSITIKFVESRSNTSDYKKLYSFKSVT